MIVGVTGSIGSGKSTVCQYLRDRGFYVVDADQVSRQLMELNEPGYQQVVSLFGKEILQDNNEIDRVALARTVFQNREAKEQLEAILHPLILETMQRMTKTYETKHSSDRERLVFWEVPLLFETKYHLHCNYSICVVAFEEQLIERVMRRSKLSEEEVRQRLTAQLPVEEKKALADFVVYNQGTLPSLHEQVDLIVTQLEGDLSKLSTID